jgi:hypothetical protein
MDRPPSRWLLLGLVPLLGFLLYLSLRPEVAPRPAAPGGVDEPGVRPPGQAAPLIPPSNPGVAYSFPKMTPEPPPESEQRCGTACFCGAAADDPCGARRTCGKGACADELGKQPWRVRLGGLKLQGASEADEELRVCIKIHGQREEACASLKETRKPACTGGARLSATTEKLLDPGLDVDIRDAQGQTVASARGVAYKFLTAREMCNGMRFGPGKFTGPRRVEELRFFLDE